MLHAETSPKLAPRMLHDNFVGEVRGFDLAGPPDDAQIAAIRSAVDRFGVLVFRGQSALRDEDLAALGERFGPLFNTGQGGFGSNRTVIHLKNLDAAGNILPIDDKFRAANAANALWHVDNSFSEPPAKYSLLLARILPPEGGETQFADARTAYEALDSATRHKIDDLETIHSYIYSRQLTGVNDWTEEQRRALPDRIRPLVVRDTGTGRRSLYLASHIYGILGWAQPAARRLIDELTDFATQPRFVYSHVWEPGDLLMYDNRMVLHRATPYPDLQYPRDLRAIRVMADI